MPRSLLLTLDAFGTLFHPRHPIPTQYAASAATFNIPVSPTYLQSTFKPAYKAQSRALPNYGRESALRGTYPGGPRQWWADVIRASFAPHEVPAALVEDLLDRFSGGRGYVLYDDVGAFFGRLRGGGDTNMNRDKKKNKVVKGFERVVVGVVSNSDDRVPGVLEALGVKVGDGRGGEEKGEGEEEEARLPGFEEVRERSLRENRRGGDVDVDVDFVVMSYHAGAEKPDPWIFDIARRHAQEMTGAADGAGDWECVHVGDDLEKDYRGALDAGWKAYLLPRGGDYAETRASAAGVRTIHSLLDLIPELEASK